VGAIAIIRVYQVCIKFRKRKTRREYVEKEEDEENMKMKKLTCLYLICRQLCDRSISQNAVFESCIMFEAVQCLCAVNTRYYLDFKKIMY